MEVYVDGEKIFDRLEEGKIYPDLGRVKKMKKQIQARLDAVSGRAAD